MLLNSALARNLKKANATNANVGARTLEKTLFFDIFEKFEILIIKSIKFLHDFVFYTFGLASLKKVVDQIGFRSNFLTLENVEKTKNQKVVLVMQRQLIKSKYK